MESLDEESSEQIGDKPAHDSVDLDDLLPRVGEFGLYQKLLLWLICWPSCLPCGFGAFNQLFMADVPDHWCRTSELYNITDWSVEEIRKMSIPLEVTSNTTYSKCYRYSVDWTEMLVRNDSFDMKPNQDWKVEKCLDGWVYNKSEITSSIVIDFDLVCDRAIYPTLGLVALNVGGPVGVYVFGILNDKIGRKKSFFACLATLLCGSALTAISQDFWTWSICRAIVGLTIPAIYQIPFIISLELVGANYRSFVTVMTCMFYTLGLLLLSGIAYLVRDWRHLALITSLPFLSYYGYWFFLPESPRWLLSQGRFEEAFKILKSLAKVNGKEIPDAFTQNLKQKMLEASLEERKPKVSIGALDLCKTPNMRLKTFLITLNWFASQVVYVGLSYYGPVLGTDQYVSFFLSAIVEIPSYLICWIIMDKWGRRWPLCLSMVLSGLFCSITVLLPADAVNSTLVLFLISKSLISASFLIIYPFAGEIYPTQVRGIGIGTSAYIGGLGLIIIPFITYLGSENLVTPLVIMGTIAALGGLCGLRLPETLHHRLPQTLEEGEEFGKDWTYVDCIRCIPIKPSVSQDFYEDLDKVELAEMRIMDLRADEATPLPRRSSMRRLVRQASTMDTQRDANGVMKMTYWF